MNRSDKWTIIIGICGVMAVIAATRVCGQTVLPRMPDFQELVSQGGVPPWNAALRYTLNASGDMILFAKLKGVGPQPTVIWSVDRWAYANGSNWMAANEQFPIEVDADRTVYRLKIHRPDRDRVIIAVFDIKIWAVCTVLPSESWVGRRKPCKTTSKR